MKTTFVNTCAVAVLSFATLASPYVMAQAADTSVRVNATPYRATAEEIGDFDNVYRLDNGQKMALRLQSGHFYAGLEGKREVELIAKGPGLFVSRSGATLEFKNDREQVLVSDAERLPGANFSTSASGRTLASR